MVRRRSMRRGEHRFGTLVKTKTLKARRGCPCEAKAGPLPRPGRAAQAVAAGSRGRQRNTPSSRPQIQKLPRRRGRAQTLSKSHQLNVSVWRKTVRIKATLQAEICRYRLDPQWLRKLLLLLLLLFLTRVDDTQCVCAHHVTMQRQSLALIYMGQCLCTGLHATPTHHHAQCQPRELRRNNSRFPSASSAYQDCESKHQLSTLLRSA